jgi:hypothetical protein
LPFEALGGEPPCPVVIAAVQTFGDLINVQPRLPLPMNEGGRIMASPTLTK